MSTTMSMGTGTGAITPSQTVGPFFAIGMAWLEEHCLVSPGTGSPGTGSPGSGSPGSGSPGAPGAITLRGRVLDGAGDPVPDGLVELWQADGQGRFPPETDPGWTGFGRCLTDEEGQFRFLTVKPGPVDGQHAPHIALSVFARGLLQRLVTRVYFPDEPVANAADPVLRSIGDAMARATLVAAEEPGGISFDIRLQGDGETVFFAY